MDFELYLAETAAHAERQAGILLEAKDRLQQQGSLTPLETGGALHALQLLTENAIGKTKHLLKQRALAVPVSAYDAFALLAQHGVLNTDALPAWQRAIGLRNRIVHDYLNLDQRILEALLIQEGWRFIYDYLKQSQAGKTA